MQIVVFSAMGTISKATNKMFAKENHLVVLELLSSTLYIHFENELYSNIVEPTYSYLGNWNFVNMDPTIHILILG